MGTDQLAYKPACVACRMSADTAHLVSCTQAAGPRQDREQLLDRCGHRFAPALGFLKPCRILPVLLGGQFGQHAQLQG